MAHVEYKIDNSIARIVLNRPQVMNAVPEAAWKELRDFLELVEFNSVIRVVVFSGAGGHFCTGSDVNEFADTLNLPAAERAAHWMRADQRTGEFFAVIDRMPQTVVVSARGYAAGGGLGLIGAADLVIASETLKLLPAQINIGAIPDTAVSFRLVHLAGLRRAKQYCLLGEEIDARTALSKDLVNWVVPDGDLETKTEEILQRLSAMPAVASSRTKAALNVAHRISLAEHWAQQTADVGACVVEDDFLKRVSSFVARRSDQMSAANF